MERQEPISFRIREDITDDPNFDRKLDLITAGAHPYVKDHLLTRISKQNCLLIMSYILAFMTEVNPAQSYRIDTIYKLKQLAEHYHQKSLKDLTRQDIIDYLDRYRKPESVDPLHKWIGTYEHTRIIFLRFFRWLYRPNDDIPHNKRPIPKVMYNIPSFNRKEVSIYKPTDLWTEEDDAIFYKYCPSVRDKCWHAVARDTGRRTHELLKLKIKDVVVQQLENGYHVARITVNGKTGTRHVRLIARRQTHRNRDFAPSVSLCYHLMHLTKRHKALKRQERGSKDWKKLCLVCSKCLQASQIRSKFKPPTIQKPQEFLIGWLKNKNKTPPK